MIPLLTIEGVHGVPTPPPSPLPLCMFSSTPLASRATLHPGDPQLLSMWRRGLPPSARGALWCMAIGNRLGLSDDDFDARVAAANSDAAPPAADSGAVHAVFEAADDTAADAADAADAAAADDDCSARNASFA